MGSSPPSPGTVHSPFFERLSQLLNETFTVRTHPSNNLGHGMQVSYMSPRSTGTASLLNHRFRVITRKRE